MHPDIKVSGNEVTNTGKSLVLALSNYCLPKWMKSEWFLKPGASCMLSRESMGLDEEFSMLVEFFVVPPKQAEMYAEYQAHHRALSEGGKHENASSVMSKLIKLHDEIVAQAKARSGRGDRDYLHFIESVQIAPDPEASY